MKAVIQCASTKNPDAGYMQTDDGERVMFVADPAGAPASAELHHARPDDAVGGGSWRSRLLAYNEQYRRTGDNPFGLLPAYQLYGKACYGALVEKLGVGNVFILSAGWGMLPADFLTPNYNITFSYTKKEYKYKRRSKRDRYEDFYLPPASTLVMFFGGKDYLTKFCELSDDYAGERIVFYNSKYRPKIKNVTLRWYETNKRTNWHYECVEKFVAGRL